MLVIQFKNLAQFECDMCIKRISHINKIAKEAFKKQKIFEQTVNDKGIYDEYLKYSFITHK